MKTIKTIGIAGAGTMGSALAQKFAQEGFDVILVDRETGLVDKGLRRIRETLNEGIERKLFTEKQTEDIMSRISGSVSLQDFKKCNVIIEAIFENIDAKRELFRDIDKIADPETILATNTSSFSVTELAGSVSHPERFIGMHYFYHAAKNRLVEIIPGENTSKETIKVMKNFAVLSGKDSIECKDSYGFVVNRFFVPWLNEAARLFEEGIGTAAEIDEVCCKTFSIGMGPFALMNATGVPVAFHAQKTLEYFGPLYKTSYALKMQTEANKPWQTDKSNGAALGEEDAKCIKERMLGIVFLVCSQILDEGICRAVEINRGARIGLRWRRGPIDLMKRLGVNEVNRLIKSICEKYNIELPGSVSEDRWHMKFVKLDKVNNTGILTISRPEDMNALNEETVCQLDQRFDEAEKDPDIKRIIIIGEGKAFVAGADVKFFVDNIRAKSLNNIVSFTAFGQQVYNKIDKCNKEVIAIVNGLTLGGGLELALSCDVILALPKAVFSFPETGIGIYPGLGGTQRARKRLGKGLAKYMIYTGDFLNAVQAERMGLIDAIIEPEDIPDIIDGLKPIPPRYTKGSADEKYVSIRDFFEEHTLDEILEVGNSSRDDASEIFGKIAGKIKKKAPLALKTAEKLIDEERGCESELEELTNIFSTSDALIGLSSIGKSVEFKGA